MGERKGESKGGWKGGLRARRKTNRKTAKQASKQASKRSGRCKRSNRKKYINIKIQRSQENKQDTNTSKEHLIKPVMKLPRSQASDKR